MRKEGENYVRCIGSVQTRNQLQQCEKIQHIKLEVTKAALFYSGIFPDSFPREKTLFPPEDRSVGFRAGCAGGVHRVQTVRQCKHTANKILSLERMEQ